MSGISFKAASAPSLSLAKTNKIYFSPEDAAFLAVPDKYAASGQKNLVKIGKFIYTWDTDGLIVKGTVGLGAMQRRLLNVSLNQSVEIFPYYTSSKHIFLSSLHLEVSFLSKSRRDVEIGLDASELEAMLKEVCVNQYLTIDQTVLSDFRGNNIVFTVVDLTVLDLKSILTTEKDSLSKKRRLEVEEGAADLMSEKRGILNKGTVVTITSTAGSGIRIIGGTTSDQVAELFKPDFDFEKLGIGGLSKEFGEIFRRAFAPRVFPPDVLKKLGVPPIKGILLYGPPGTGKTLMARCIGKMLNGKEPKVVNGPEVLNKYVGQSEENIRDLFREAEEDWNQYGVNSALHIIVMDELDAICKTRGSRSQGGTGVGDSIVNQLLSKMDGYKQIDNILIIGMTNRKDMIDEALLRPGRMEVHVEIGLPDEQGRLHILNIHTSKMKNSGYLDKNVDLEGIAKRTKNYSGADLAGLVKNAASYAINRKVDMQNPSNPVDPDSVLLIQEDFENALVEMRPLFGVDERELSKNIGNGIIEYGPVISRVLEQCKGFFDQVKNSSRTPLVTVLLDGAIGSGKTALASHIALFSQFPYAKMVTSEDMLGYTESQKVGHISGIFEDAYRSPLSFVVVDEIERLIEYVRIGPRFSNIILQTLIVSLKKLPPAGRKLFVIGTTSKKEILEDLDVLQLFDARTTIPNVAGVEEVSKVLRNCDYSDEEIESVQYQIVDLEIPVKKLIMVAEIAKQEEKNLSLPEKFAQGLRDYGANCATD